MSVTVSKEQLWPVLESADSVFFISVASTALVFYEYAITFNLEVQQIWKGSISGVTILFILTRYITLLHRTLVIISLSSLHSLDTCYIVTWLQAFTSSILIVVMSAIAAVRIYALWNRDRRLFAVIMVAGMFPAITNLYFRSASAVFLAPTHLFTCQSVPTAMSALVYKKLSVATRVLSIFSDGMVVMFTWIKTYRIFVLTRGVKFRTNYPTLILRDGTLYFLAVCVFNVVAIVYVMNIGSNLLNDVIVTLSSILMSRFLLNLRNQRARNERQSLTPSTALSSRPFSTIKFSSDLSHSMAGGVMDDDEPDPERDADVDEKDGDLWRCDTLASTSTEATSKELFVPRENVVRGGAHSLWPPGLGQV